MDVKAGFGIEFLHNLKQEIVCSVVFKETFTQTSTSVGTSSSDSNSTNNATSNTHNNKNYSIDTSKSLNSMDSQDHYKILTFHRDGFLNLWSFKSSFGIKLTRRVKCLYSIEQLIFSHNQDVFIALTNQNLVMFFDHNLELLKTIAFDNLQSISYCQSTSWLAMANLNEVQTMEVSLETQFRKSKLDIIKKYTLNPKMKSTQAIHKLMIESKRRKLVIMYDNGIQVFDLFSGICVAVNDTVAKRTIVDLVYFEIPQMYVAGTSDGQINLLNETLSNLNKFSVCRGTITAFAKHPNGTHLILASSDMQIRMIQVHNLQTIFTYNLPCVPSFLNFISSSHMILQSLKSIGVLRINLFGNYLAQLSSNIKRLWSIPRQDKPWQLVAMSEEGLLRIVSTVSGKSITSLLPTSSLDELQSMVYCEKIGKLFLLMGSGNIWTVSTKTNPCQITEVWTCGYDRPTCLALWSIKTRSESITEKYLMTEPYRTEKMVDLLVAGTMRGSLSLFDRFGAIRTSHQIHTTKIVSMSYMTSKEYMLCLTEDHQIKIVSFNLNAIKFNCVMGFNLHILPLEMACSNDTVCYSGDDGVIHMTRFDLETKVSEDFSHSRNDDHFDKVNALVYCANLNVFVSGSCDSLMKVWSNKNQLVRTVNVRHPITTLCAGNQNGDIVLGIQDKLESISPSVYLPETYMDTRRVLGFIPQVDDYLEPKEINLEDETQSTTTKSQVTRRFGMESHREKVKVLNLLEGERTSSSLSSKENLMLENTLHVKGKGKGKYHDDLKLSFSALSLDALDEDLNKVISKIDDGILSRGGSMMLLCKDEDESRLEEIEKELFENGEQVQLMENNGQAELDSSFLSLDEKEDDDYVERGERTSTKFIAPDGFIPNTSRMKDIPNASEKAFDAHALLARRAQLQEELLAKQVKEGEKSVNQDAYRERIKQMLNTIKEKNEKEDKKNKEEEARKSAEKTELEVVRGSRLRRKSMANFAITPDTNKLGKPEMIQEDLEAEVKVEEEHEPPVIIPTYLDLIYKSPALYPLVKLMLKPSTVPTRRPGSDEKTTRLLVYPDHPSQVPTIQEALRVLEKQFIDNLDANFRRAILDYIVELLSLETVKPEALYWFSKVFDKAESIESTKLRMLLLEYLRKISYLPFALPYIFLMSTSDVEELRIVANGILLDLGLESPLDVSIQRKVFAIAYDHALLYSRVSHMLYIESIYSKEQIKSEVSTNLGHFFSDYESFLNFKLQTYLGSQIDDEKQLLALKAQRSPVFQPISSNDMKSDLEPSQQQDGNVSSLTKKNNLSYSGSIRTLEIWINPKSENYIQALNFLALVERKKKKIREQQALAEATQKLVTKEKPEKKPLYKGKEDSEKQAELFKMLRQKNMEKSFKQKQKEEEKEKYEKKMKGLNAPHSRFEIPYSLSKCHQSRETMEFVYRTLPPIEGNQPARKATSILTDHLRRLNTALPIEKPKVRPFSEREDRPTTSYLHEDEHGNRSWKKYYMMY